MGEPGAKFACARPATGAPFASVTLTTMYGSSALAGFAMLSPAIAFTINPNYAMGYFWNF